MEEDIKVLEEIKNHQVAFFDPIQQKEILKYYLKEGQRQAIENLIKRNKELEYKLEIEKIDNKYNQEERDEETIPRYKIREKIEEYKWASEGYDSDTADYGQSQAIGAYIALIELLQEGDDN